MEYWIVTYETDEEIRHLRHTGFNCATLDIEHKITKKTIPIKGTISTWLANSSGDPVILYSKEITLKEYKNLTE